MNKLRESGSVTYLVDMTWFFSSSKNRGIGKYLSYLIFTRLKNDKLAKLVLLIPEKYELIPTMLSDFTQEELNYEDQHRLVDQLQLLSKKYSNARILIGSPFEYPFSLINKATKIAHLNIPIDIVIHDLLPLEFPYGVYLNWSEEIQFNYLKQLSMLKYVSTFFMTGKQATRQFVKHFPKYFKNIKIIEFGERYKEWIKIPDESLISSPAVEGKYLVTISGGEWRKNLFGTILFFQHYFPRSWRLVVICKLGRIERVKIQLWLATHLMIHRVIFMGEITEEMKWNCILHAKSLVCLSFGEGLNLPVLEAKAANISVICHKDI